MPQRLHLVQKALHVNWNGTEAICQRSGTRITRVLGSRNLELNSLAAVWCFQVDCSNSGGTIFFARDQDEMDFIKAFASVKR